MPEEKTEAELAVETETAALAEAELLEEEEARETAEKAAEEEEGVTRSAEEAGVKKGSYQERINAMTYKQRSAERERDYYRDIVLGRNKTEDGGFVSPAGEKRETTTGTPGDTRPKPGDFETVETYEDALYGWYDAKRETKVLAKTAEDDLKKLLSAFNESAAPLRIEHPDFDEVTARPVFTPSMRQAVFNLDEGALVAYELGNNPELAAKIKMLPPDKQLYEMSKLERKLVLIRKVTGKSNTPNPLAHLTGRTKKETDPDKMPIGAWMEWDKNQRMAKLKTKLGIK